MNNIFSIRAKYKHLCHKDLDHYGCYVPDGWVPIVASFFNELDKLVEETPNGEYMQVSCIKSKFGSLRIYLDPPIGKTISPGIAHVYYNLASKFEGMTSGICSNCGSCDSYRENGRAYCTVCKKGR